MLTSVNVSVVQSYPHKHANGLHLHFGTLRKSNVILRYCAHTLEHVSAHCYRLEHVSAHCYRLRFIFWVPCPPLLKQVKIRWEHPFSCLSLRHSFPSLWPLTMWKARITNQRNRASIVFGYYNSSFPDFLSLRFIKQPKYEGRTAQTGHRLLGPGFKPGPADSQLGVLTTNPLQWKDKLKKCRTEMSNKALIQGQEGWRAILRESSRVGSL